MFPVGGPPVIVITGSERSGTSALARLCQELGVDPGGSWNGRADAGLEDGRVVELNERITAALGAGHYQRPRTWYRLARGAAWRLRPARRVVSWIDRTGGLEALRYQGRWRHHWDRVDDLAKLMGGELCAYASEHRVVKDPRFLWTLPVWFAAGAAIDHVVLTVRTLPDAYHSRKRAGLLRGIDLSWFTESVLAGYGASVHAAALAGVSVSWLVFPAFLTQPGVVWSALGQYLGVDRGDFDRAFTVVMDPDRYRIRGPG